MCVCVCLCVCVCVRVRVRVYVCVPCVLTKSLLLSAYQFLHQSHVLIVPRRVSAIWDEGSEVLSASFIILLSAWSGWKEGEKEGGVEGRK